jgi:RimJ/RimL family protein N-acetyltransferase
LPDAIAGPVITTARLSLHRLTPDDIDFVATMLGDPEVMRFYPHPLSRDEARDWIERQIERYAQDGHGLWLVRGRATGEPVGQAGLSMQEVDGVRRPEIGYLLHRPFWGLGYATEAAAATRDWAFETRGHPEVTSLIRPENLRSRAVAGRLGMAVWGATLWAGIEHLVYGMTRTRPPRCVAPS